MAVRDRHLSQRIEELERQIESVLYSADQGEFDELSVHRAVALENRRAHQEAARRQQ